MWIDNHRLTPATEARLQRITGTLVFSCLLLAASSRAQDAFFCVNYADLTEPRAAATEVDLWRRYALHRLQGVRVVVDHGEGYPSYPDEVDRWRIEELARPSSICVRAPAGKPVVGKLLVPNAGWTGMDLVPFTIPAEAASAEAEATFYAAKRRFLTGLLESGVPGAAWFRHQLRRLDTVPGGRAVAVAPMPFDSEWETYSLFSGGRALSENLQLERVLQPEEGGDALVALDTLKGIEVKEFDWSKLLGSQAPAADPLAAAIPHDQHAIFVPSFTALTTLIDEADKNGTPVLQMLEPRAEDAGVLARYQRQLCLSTSSLSRLLGPELIASLALTGADPYLRVGADVAVLFEPKDAAVLRPLLLAQIALRSQQVAAAEPVKGEIAGVGYQGHRSPDRTVCAYVATVGSALVVTNSLAQLQRLIEVDQGKSQPLAAIDEYRFFRQRYPRGDADETAFILVSDATIRRWCGPRWRIGDSRRTRAGALLCELQAEHVIEAAGQVAATKPLTLAPAAVDLGRVEVGPAGVVSAVYGSLGFMTPILELPLDQATKSEAEHYGRWRDTYQRNWQQYFDPIAIRFGISARELRADISVMPLIANTDYRELIEVTRGVKINLAATDPHDALGHLTLAINRESRPVREIAGFLSDSSIGARLDVLGWLGTTFSLWVDPDPFWEQLAAAEDGSQFLRQHWAEMPIALHMESVSPVKLVAFLAGLKKALGGIAPEMLEWETREHAGTPYVCIVPSAQAREMEREAAKVRLYYAAMPDGWLLTIHEKLLQRALERRAARAAVKPADPPPAHPVLLGEQVAARIDGRLLQVLEHGARAEARVALQVMAFGNLPILNEWRRLFPDHDPVAIHERLFGARLLCPGGGAFVWNEELATMESSAYGCPARPKPGPDAIPGLVGLMGADLGLTFEQDGLRARVVVARR